MVNKNVTSINIENINICSELESEINSLVTRNCEIRDNFLISVKETITEHSQLDNIAATMQEEITPLAHQIYALEKVIEEAKEFSGEEKDITKHLEVISFLFSSLEEKMSHSNKVMPKNILKDIGTLESSTKKVEQTVVTAVAEEKQDAQIIQDLDPQLIIDELSKLPDIQSDIMRLKDEAKALLNVRSESAIVTRMTQRELAEINAKIAAHEEELAHIDGKCKFTAEDKAEMAHIGDSEALIEYYQVVQKSFNEVFNAANMISSGEIEIEASSDSSDILNALAGLASPIPFASTILTAAAALSDQYSQAKKIGQFSNISDLNPTSSPVNAALFSEKIARRLAVTNEEEIIEAKAKENSATKPSPKIKDISDVIERVKKVAQNIKNTVQDKASKMDSAASRGFFGEDFSTTQLLAIENSASAIEYVMNQDQAEINQTKAKAATVIDDVKQTALIDRIVSKAMDKDVIKLSSSVKDVSDTAKSSFKTPINMNKNVDAKKTSQPTTLQDQLKAAIKHKKDEIEAAEKVGVQPSANEPKVDGFTRHDIEEIIKQTTGGLSLDAIQFLKDRFQEDQIRKERTGKKAQAGQVDLVKEITELLAGKSSDDNVRVQDIFKKDGEPNVNLQDQKDSSPASSIRSVTNVENISQDAKRIAELEEQLKAQNEKMESQQKMLTQILKNQQDGRTMSHSYKELEKRENSKKGKDCCVIS